MQLWLTEGDIDHIIALDTELMRCDAWGSILALATNRCRGLLSLCISDHPLAFVADLGIETGVAATKIAALVWGRDDDGGGLTFKRDDIEKIVQIADHRASHSIYYPMREDHGQAILSLCISDLNKELLLGVNNFLPLLVDSLLLDPEHPRMENVTLQGKTDWEAAKGPVQRVRDSYLYDSCPVVQQLLAFY